MKIKAPEGFKKLFADSQKSPHYHAQKHQLEVAEAVYNYKQKHSLTVKDLADISGISIVRLHEILKANANLTILSTTKLAMALDMELSVEMKEKEAKA